jgi:putative ABC transport system permease protein
MRDVETANVDVGLIRLDPHREPAVVRGELERALPPEIYGVRVLTLPELKNKERLFWLQHTPIGFIFLLGVFLGFVVGVVICFQILASEIRDHLGEYATLKAMGYGNPFLRSVILRQALWLAVLGFLPGLVASSGLYLLLERLTGLPMGMDVLRVGGVLVLTVVMCIVSAHFAVRKLFSVDPAELFR